MHLDCTLHSDESPVTLVVLCLVSLTIKFLYQVLGYEPADLTVHPPPPRTAARGFFFSYRCLVFPKKCPQRKACAFQNYSG